MTMVGTEPSRAPRRRPRRWALTWTIAAVLASVGAAVLPYLEIRGVAAIPVAQALVPVGVLVLLVLALTSLVLRIWAAAIVLLVSAVVSGVPTLTPIAAGQQCETVGSVTVLSFNAKLAGADPAALSELIRTTNAGVAMLLETDEALIGAVLARDGLAEALPYRTREVSDGPASGSVILSSYPLSKEEDVPGSEFDQVSAVAAVPGAGDVRLAAVHPPPPVWQPNGWRNGIDDVGAWVRQASDERLIVAGDFNASFAHPALRRFASGLRTAAEAAGPLPWATWPEEKPVPAFTAIDHIFGRGAIPSSWESSPVAGSDHRAVIATWHPCCRFPVKVAENSGIPR